MPQWTLWLAAAIILVLAGYAGHLLWKLDKLKRQQQADASARRTKLTEDIRLIARACRQEQCEPAEGALRLVNLLRALPAQTPDALRDQYPRLHALYDKVCDQPILEARKALKRNERMKLDLERARWEDELAPAMQPELDQLAQLH